MGDVSRRVSSRSGRVHSSKTRRTRKTLRGRHPHDDHAPGVVRCAVLTVSDTRRGRADRSGGHIQRLLTDAGHLVVSRGWTSDDQSAIRRTARALLDRRDVDVLIVTGGTGISPRDSTPQALERLVKIWLPGFGETFRALSFRQVGSAAWLSRAAAGLSRGRLVVLLPGSTPAVDLALRRLLIPELSHVLSMLERNHLED